MEIKMKKLLLGSLAIMSISAFAEQFYKDNYLETKNMYRCTAIGEKLNQHTGRYFTRLFYGRAYDNKNTAKNSALGRF